MKLTYLGTSAAEGFPALFCNCKNCRAAKELGGKNIRTRSQSIINDDLLIDFPPDTHYHFFHNKIEADRIKYLIITHGHVDHFYPSDLMRKRHPYAWEMREPTLRLVCSETLASGLDLTDKNIELTATTKPGYKFDGWYYKNQPSVIVEKIKAGTVGSKILCAKITPMKLPQRRSLS